MGLLWALLLAAGGTAAGQEPTPRHWDPAVAGTLLAYINRIDSHGLDPANYAPLELERAIASGDRQALERQATDSFSRVALDLSSGQLTPGRRGRFFIASDTLEPARAARLIDTAIASGSVDRVLEQLAPQSRDYAALRAALARLAPGQLEERRKIEVNLERWRWLPRERGRRHLLVNIPEYSARLIDGSAGAAVHRVIVGKPSTPTPQFSAVVSAVVLNPSWNVPQSIIRESVGRLVRNSPATARARGYTWSYAGGGLRVTQQPGPQNALGQVKLDMPNPFTVYLHDTPNKELFDEEDRTFSHGCIRTDKPFDLAVDLLDSREWSRASVDDAVATRKTRRLPLTDPVPVFVVYLTAVATPDGVRYLDDPYRLDAAISVQLGTGR